MAETLPLKERTAAVIGPLTSLSQNIAKTLSELGCDIVLIGSPAEPLQRLANLINDHREINEKFGRAAVVNSKLSTEKETADALSNCVQSFGSLEILIDMQAFNSKSAIKEEGSKALLQEEGLRLLQSRYWIAKTFSGFLKNRKRGRAIFVIPSTHLSGFDNDGLACLLNGGLPAFVKAYSTELSDLNATANLISLGPTEDYLLAHYPESTSPKEALEKFKVFYPNSKIVDGDKIAQAISFLCQPAGQSMNGQTLTLV